jgi:copper chaperone CopZ
VPTAEAALRSAPGVLAVTVDYEAKTATVGTAAGQPVPEQAILDALEAIKYSGKVIGSGG